MPDQKNPRIELNLDLEKLRQVGYLGPRRASAFLCFGLTPTRGEPPKSATLNHSFNIQFLPDPLPTPLAEQIVGEYRIWLIGNALRELDLHYHLFLDQAWATAQFAALHGKSVKSNYIIPQVSQETNAASKMKKLYKVLNASDEKALSQLWSVTNARNCLTHSAGIVTPRFANIDCKQLGLRWLGQQVRLEQGEEFVEIGPEFQPLQAPDPSKEANVVVRLVEKERRFDVGKQIDLSAHDLHEICFFFMQLVDQTIEHLLQHTLKMGIPNQNP